jgi:CubicO group peptidase (beta-lactamase class C family)
MGSSMSKGRRRWAWALGASVCIVALPFAAMKAMRSNAPHVPQTVTIAAPAPVPSITAERLARAHAIAEAGVGEAYPGVVMAVGLGGDVVDVTAFGKIGWRDASPPVIADSTLYDLASLTKAMATTVAVLLLVQDGAISLDDPVRRHLPAFEGEWKDRVTWRHLLTHTSGLPAGAAIRGSTDAERARRLLRTKLGVPPGVQVTYSDIGYVVLWAAAERVAGEPLPKLLERRVWQPLGMNATSFSPGRDCEACAPTLRLRTGEPFRGVPADQLARAVGGVTGSAGLFGTISDVARFAALMANDGELDGVRILDAQLVDELFTQQPKAGRRSLGWTAFCPDEEPDAQVACAQPIAYGHTGWTGTSFWIDPQDGYWVVLLTNRSYERPNRPWPLDGLRRDVFLQIAGRADAEPGAWLARVTATPTSAPEPRQNVAPPRGASAR